MNCTNCYVLFLGMHNNFQTMPPTPGQGPTTPAHQRQQMAQTMNVSIALIFRTRYRYRVVGTAYSQNIPYRQDGGFCSVRSPSAAQNINIPYPNLTLNFPLSIVYHMEKKKKQFQTKIFP
jgi:hypothetical protein